MNTSPGPPGSTRADVADWLRSGRLTLLDAERRAVDVAGWDRLPADSRARVQAEFERVVRGHAKAAVLYVK
jgi:hypothetical protein